MNKIIDNKQFLMNRALERAEALIALGTTFELRGERGDFAAALDAEYRDELGLWFERQLGRYFTREETTLQCVVALRYADVTRPTVRELWQYLQVLILRDARMMPGGRPLRFPSYTTFRGRITDLPRTFVWKAREGADEGRPSVTVLVSRFDAIVSRQA
ncbi:hypothetical protein HFN01_32430 [Rhizobium leguminosarum]|uniref:hypothetical protein n=1 Tax=Rhizobium leguminosarum TaxID=384 RepID=UPI001C93DFE9|nr:hypothetical protein [Rhizobium leguminosarum]MBY5399509.1 hypothetical protein [Rhizobium leguminosarum]